EASTADSDESFDALFRSDGELAQPSTAGSLDIDLQSEVEPASLDDAVDSRLLTFVQQADRAERWRSPRVRVALACGSLPVGVRGWASHAAGWCSLCCWPRNCWSCSATCWSHNGPARVRWCNRCVHRSTAASSRCGASISSASTAAA